MTIFLDSSALIYWVEVAEPFYSKFIKTMAELNSQYPRSRLAVSRLSTLECRVKPLRDQNDQLLSLYDELFSAVDLEIVELSKVVVDLATRLRADSGLRTPDALQAGAAMSLGGRVIVVTGDDHLQRVSGLEVMVT